jgi:hypothetical protein
MPALKDAPVLLTGQVIDTAVIKNRDTEAFEGRKVTIMVADGASDPGFAVVKIVGDDAINLNPNHFETVAWFVRNAPYDITDGGRRNSGMSTRFLRVANEGDLDKLVSAVQNPVKKAA